MDLSKYYEARDVLLDIMAKDFIGPVSDDEIICDENPLDFYITGKLYPQSSEADFVTQSPADDIGELDEEDSIALCNGRNPASFGLSFSLAPNTKTFSISSFAAKYASLSKEEAQEILGFEDKKYKDKAQFWKREKIEPTPIIIDTTFLIVGKSEKYNISEGLTLNILLHKIYEDKSSTITVSMINEYNEKYDHKEESAYAFFQPWIQISSEEDYAFTDVRKNIRLNKDPEIVELDLLYSRCGSYASGHGCAVNWETDDKGNPTVLKTSFLPMYEIKQMMPATLFEDDVLQMKFLSEAPVETIIVRLRKLTVLYKAWIDRQEKEEIVEPLHEAAIKNIEKCRTTFNRIEKSISELKKPDVYRAFALANKAMFTQRKQMLINSNKYDSDEKIKWYPFQLAFFLQEISSFSEPESKERKLVDLLWFPTGGGKTEAYLGIAAYVIFLRRIRNGDSGNGVTVLMRYTLRLLSFQQFERASALICACELIRKEERIPGGEIGIGLWAGMGLTPNYINVAAAFLNGEADKYPDSGNPTQIKKCPWCGENIPSELPFYKCNEANKRMLIKCANPTCPFQNGLPIYLIDEEIYIHRPTYIVATVDKFAQIALNENTGNLFGINQAVLPPELIIQDELHLISGPLGTITGLYEAAIKKLCESNGHSPKVIASTATIRNAKEQINALYASDFTQFPPQGLDINDSFFAEVSNKTQKPARMYIGCMAIGTSPTTMMIRVMSALLFASRYLVELGYEEKVIDSFWTITGYFNTLRELGGAIVRVVDDIQDRFKYLKWGKFAKLYPMTKCRDTYANYKELTSREKSENIGDVIQNELKIPYSSNENDPQPYDFLLASNMISVGVDVARLGAMVVVGQPKSTAEYIQATSRVGRETPGLVVTTYNQAKSRDRSHYEQFTQYHNTFYKYVEATSVTPFSDRARDRALHTLYVILCRYLIEELRCDASAARFNRKIKGLANIRAYILNYVKIVDPDEVGNVSTELDEIEEKWETKAYRKDHLWYKKTRGRSESDTLFDPDYKEDSRFRVLNTMRSVETTVKVTTKE